MAEGLCCMFRLAFILACVYLIWRFAWQLPVNQRIKAAVAVALIVFSQYHLLLQWAYGSMFSPEMPRWIVVLASGAFCWVVILLLFTLLLDALALLGHVANVKKGLRLTQTNRAWLLTLVSLSLTSYGVHQAIQVPAVKTVELVLPGLDKHYDGMRIVQLSDLHISRLFDRDWAAAVVDKTNALKPELILVSGDLIDGTVLNRTEDIAPLQALSAPLGVYASLGNHEYYFDAKDWVARFEQLGVRVLANESVVIGENRFNLAAVTDESAAQFAGAEPDVATAVGAINSALPILLLKHQPRDAALSAELGVGIQLSGHTHGGMILGVDYFLGLFNQGFMSGAYQVDEMTLYVSNGTALWPGFPIRLGVGAEITEITLRSSPEPQ